MESYRRPIRFWQAALIVLVVLALVYLTGHQIRRRQIQSEYERHRSLYLKHKVRWTERLEFQIPKFQKELHALLDFKILPDRLDSSMKPTELHVPKLPSVVDNLYRTTKRDDAWKLLLRNLIEQVDFEWMKNLNPTTHLMSRDPIADIQTEPCSTNAWNRAVESEKNLDETVQWTWLRWEKAAFENRPHEALKETRTLIYLLLSEGTKASFDAALSALREEENARSRPWTPWRWDESRLPMKVSQIQNQLEFLPMIFFVSSPVPLKEAWDPTESPFICLAMSRTFGRHLAARTAQFEKGADLGDIVQSVAWFERWLEKNQTCHFADLKTLWKENARDRFCQTNPDPTGSRIQLLKKLNDYTPNWLEI